MKKSQVLAALALAMALGVAAPIASTFALTNYREDCTKTADEAEEIILSLGDQTTTNTVRDAQYHIDILKNAFAPDEATFNAAFTGTAPTAGKAMFPIYHIVNLATNYQGKVDGKLLRTSDFAGKNFSQVVALADSADYTATNLSQVAFDQEVAIAEAGYDTFIANVRSYLNALGLGSNLAKDATAAQTVSYVDSLVNYKKTYDLYKVWAANYGICTGNAHTEKQVNKANDVMKDAIAAYKGTTNNGGNTNTPVKPSTPDTGANTASEESATASVSILSGVASVVTAAGVVIRKAFRK